MFRYGVNACAILLIAAALGCGGESSTSDPSSEEAQPDTADSPTTLGEEYRTATPTERVRGQVLYVPAYSHIYLRDAERTINLTTTLSVRNTSLDRRITISRVDYFDGEGALVRSYLKEERTLGPLASSAYVVDLDDLRGGVGANFIVRWRSEEPVPPPVVESVMITGAATQGISYLSAARVLYEEPAEP